MDELTEDNDFGLALAERPSIVNQGKTFYNYYTKYHLYFVIFNEGAFKLFIYYI